MPSRAIGLVCLLWLISSLAATAAPPVETGSEGEPVNGGRVSDGPVNGEPDLSRADCPVTGEPAVASCSAKLSGGVVFFSSDEALRQYRRNPRDFVVPAHAQLVVTGQAVQVGCPLTEREISAFHWLTIEEVEVCFADSATQTRFADIDPQEWGPRVFGSGPFLKAFRVNGSDRSQAPGRKAKRKPLEAAEAKRRAEARGPSTEAEAEESNQRLALAMQAQDRNFNKLMFVDGVTGTAATFDANSRPIIAALVETMAAAADLPAQVDGVPVVPVVVGRIFATQQHGERAELQATNPQRQQPRPVPIGVSTGVTHANSSCSSGTLGCRLKGKNLDGSPALFALSNNHVFASSNKAPLESVILQPGLADSRCRANLTNSLGTLTRFQSIQFGRLPNRIDAAIAKVTADKVGRSTPVDGGYGTPRSTPATPAVSMPVMKYGRTTGRTLGRITGLNASVYVTYSGGTALFTGQITVGPRSGSTAFSRSGDSGSLVVTDPGRGTVGLLFAGNSDGSYTICNQISEVLSAFRSWSVQIDGE